MVTPMTCKKDVPRFLHNAAGRQLLWSLKMDGVRTVASVMADGTITYSSRTKKAFFNFDGFSKGLVRMAQYLNQKYLVCYPVMFDGEMMSKDKTFSKVMTQLRRLKDVDQTVFEFNIFDIVMPETAFATRFELLARVFREVKVADIKLVPHFPVDAWTLDTKIIKRMAKAAVNVGYEGVVLKLADSPYEQRKSGLWCKVKTTDTVDLKVIGHELGGGKYENKLGALICEFGEGTVSVGSGYTDAQREELLANIPSVIEVEYQEITKDGSLRFPIFKRVRDDKEVERNEVQA